MNKKQTMPSYLVELEHELADANDRIRLLIAERNTARLQADQRVSLREEFRELLGTDEIEQGVVVVRGLQDRIKRLEEAGDEAMKSLSCGCPHGDSVFHCQTCTNSWDAWHKAKEAKP
jgi:hypothetical protein